MSKWKFGTHLTFTFNPSRDTGWTTEHVRASPHPIGRIRSVYQKGGHKSRTRKIEGLIKSKTEHDTIDLLYRNEQNFYLVDHMDDRTNNICIDELKWDSILDASNSDNFFTSYKYEITLVQAK